MDFKEKLSKPPCRTLYEIQEFLLQDRFVIPLDGDDLVFRPRHDELIAMRTDDAAQADMMVWNTETQSEEWAMPRNRKGL
jgi:hypothetical protein